MKLNIDMTEYTAKPEGAEVGAIVKRLKQPDKIEDVTLNNVKAAVCSGMTITAGALAGTAEKDWTSQQVFIFDIDNEAQTLPKLTPQDVLTLLEANHVPVAFMYWTFSNTPEHAKFRVVTVCDEVITDPDEAKKIIKGVLGLFPTARERNEAGKETIVSQIDLACKNLDRIFYGTNQGLVESIGNEQPFNKADTLKLYQEEQPKELPLPLAIPRQQPTASPGFDLAASYDTFNLLDYILSTTNSRVARRRGNETMLNPCPVCGHKDDFFVNTTKNTFKCHSSSNGVGGNILNYLMEKELIDNKTARNKFKYEILGIDQTAEREAWKEEQRRKKVLSSNVVAFPGNENAPLGQSGAAEQSTQGTSQSPVIYTDNSSYSTPSQEQVATVSDRELDLIRVKYDPDFTVVTFKSDEGKTVRIIKSRYIKAGRPGTYLHETPQEVSENVILLLAHYNLTLKYNVLKNRLEVYKNGVYLDTLERKTAYIMDKCKIQDYKVAQQRLESQLEYAARTYGSYNPIEDYLKDCYQHYDPTHDYIQDMCGTIDTPISDSKKRMYIERFLLQMVWVACGAENDTEHHGEFCLTLQGRQGFGKTRWLRNLLPEHLRSEYFLDSRSMDLSKKDDILEQATVWLCEMGEIAATFRKSDQETIKAYVTSAIDKVRPPYGKEAIVKKRRMTLSATTNDAEFLRDRTGDRRFVVLPCLKVDYLHDVDLTKLWAQVYHEFVNGNDRYYFTIEEIETLLMDNRVYRVKSELEYMLSEVFDLFPEEKPEDWTEAKYWYKASQIQAKLQQKGLDIRQYSLRKITQTLKEIGCKQQIEHNTALFFLKLL